MRIFLNTLIIGAIVYFPLWGCASENPRVSIKTELGDIKVEIYINAAPITASNFLKAISHEGRLMILCHLVSGEKSVTELENLLSARQAAVSQQLSRLRLEGLVQPRRDGKTIYYSLTDDRPRKILEVVYELFCKNGDAC